MGGEESGTTHFGSSMGLTYMIVKIQKALFPPSFIWRKINILMFEVLGVMELNKQ